VIVPGEVLVTRIEPKTEPLTKDEGAELVLVQGPQIARKDRLRRQCDIQGGVYGAEVGLGSGGADPDFAVHLVGERHAPLKVHHDERAARAAPEADLPVGNERRGLTTKQPEADPEPKRKAQDLPTLAHIQNHTA
jgi:hypothetical protein